MNKLTVSLSIIVALLLISIFSANATTVDYTVTVEDSNGNPIQGALVSICLTQSTPGHTIQGTTNSSGVVVFQNIETGSYFLTVSASGYITYNTTTTVSTAPRQYVRIEIEEEDPGI